MIFQLLALGCFAALYGCYLAKMLAQKKQGIQTDHLGEGKVGFVKFVELGTKFAAALVITAGLVSILLNLNTGRSPAPVRAAGAALGVLGAAVFIAAVRTMRDSWRAGVSESEQTELVTTGIYRFSRNPAFLGFDLLHLGTLLMFFNGPLCALTVLSILMYHLQIVNVEEDFLIAAFKDEYLQYRKTVRRYLGRKRRQNPQKG